MDAKEQVEQGGNFYYEPIEDRLWYQERIWPCHAGGYYWRVEVLELLPGPAYGFDEVAMATAPVKWIARWRLRRAGRRLRAQAVTASKEPTK